MIREIYNVFAQLHKKLLLWTHRLFGVLNLSEQLQNTNNTFVFKMSKDTLSAYNIVKMQNS